MIYNILIKFFDWLIPILDNISVLNFIMFLYILIILFGIVATLLDL